MYMLMFLQKEQDSAPHIRERRTAQPMKYKVKIIYNGKAIEPSDYPKYVIVNKTVDRIVNDIYENALADKARTA